MLYVVNVGKEDPDGQSNHAWQVREQAEAHGGMMVSLCAKLEAELVELAESECSEMLEGLGLHKPALAVLARALHKCLGLFSFFTAGPKEIRA